MNNADYGLLDSVAAMYVRRLLLLTLILALALPLAAQRRPTPTPRVPVETPPGWPQERVRTGLPWPAGLGRKEALTGHIAAIDQDQMMVRSLDYGEVLFWVDARTIVRVDKFQLTLADLRVGDPVAVRLKNIKGRGPYATEILPHPDVRARKERGETAARPEASAGGHGAFVPPDTAAPPLPGAAPPTQPSGESAEEFPALRPGSTGVVGTVTAAGGDSLELRDTRNQTQKILVTGVTLIKRAGSETILPAVKPGDRVAITGDRLDSGEWIAREVLVQSPRSEVQAATTGAGALPGQRREAETGAVSPDGLVRFSGVIASLGSEEIRVRTARGERTVMITGVTEVRRMGIRGNFASLKQGDEVSVVGDLLEGGVVLAREVTVTRLAGS